MRVPEPPLHTHLTEVGITEVTSHGTHLMETQDLLGRVALKPLWPCSKQSVHYWHCQGPRYVEQSCSRQVEGRAA
eukprot:28947-Eustigmatos_ZCMA.PRE.1